MHTVEDAGPTTEAKQREAAFCDRVRLLLAALTCCYGNQFFSPQPDSRRLTVSLCSSPWLCLENFNADRPDATAAAVHCYYRLVICAADEPV